MINGEYDYFNNDAIVWDHPVDRLEPELLPADEVRDARLTAIHLLNEFAAEMLSALTYAMSARDGLIRLFGIAHAMGLNICGDLSMSARAAQIGCERASISKIATAWNIAHDLPPSFGQKSMEANQEFARARRESVRASSEPHKRAKPFKPMTELPP
jgi:hypothetical protein